ncbi:MAG TPA: FAD-dependent monooxygenase [Streptosporangiaceae bacterium]|nr:FAD-dependent monooxygenase [Streptosporangiaceae bacterium]
MRTTPVEPVLIAGAGPVGLVTALLLARWQVPSVVLESAAAERTHAGSRAICFQRDALDVFDRVGCAEDMVAEGVTWTTGRTFYRSSELFAVTFPTAGTGSLPPWINISQASVERYLLARAKAEPLIELRFSHPVTGVDADEDGVSVQAGQASLRGSHLVGADGSRSAVRQLLGIGFPGRSFDDQFLICDIRADLSFPSERRFFFDPSWNPGRQVLVHQCPHGVWRIDWQVPAGFDLDAERASGALDQRIRQITGGLPYEIVWATAYRFHERVAEVFAAGRSFLAGDAAHLYAPFGARGLNSGAQDAENLAWKLAFVRRGWAPATLLDSYDRERSAAARENLRVTAATMEFLVPQTENLRRRRRDALEQALADPSARSLINSGKLAEPYWYTTSPLTTPGPALDGFPVTPGASRPPVPGVICPDGQCVADGTPTRLRRLFGSSLVLLTERASTAAAARLVASTAISAPVTSYALGEIDQGGGLGAALDASADSVHVVRPDGHLAAVLPRFDPVQLAAALRRAIGAHS